MEAIIKQFFDWTKRKIFHHLNEVSEKQVFYREKEIWWAALGQNIGFEIDGKHDLFERPILILKRYNSGLCFVVPFTTQVKEPLPWYQVLVQSNKDLGAANITQARVMSIKRLLRRQTVLGQDEFNVILLAFISQFKIL